eukprot:4689506-Pleurochrysis_carterae.AAC.2
MAETASEQAGAMRGSGGERTVGGERAEAARRLAQRWGLKQVHPPDRPKGSGRVCARLRRTHTPPGAKGRRGREAPMAYRPRSPA